MPPAAPSRIELAQPSFTAGERRRVVEVLEGTSVVGGPVAREFAAAGGDVLGLPHALAVACGTAALHLALLALGIGPGDEVLAPSVTFVAPVNAIRYVGATPVLIDVEPAHGQLDPDLVAAWIAEHAAPAEDGRLVDRATGRRIRAILPVDLLGHPADLQAIRRIADRHGLLVVQDAAEALGATYRGEPVGRHADVVCLSFNANKIITTCGGGMLLSPDLRVVERARLLANQAKSAGHEYDHAEVGFNYPMGEIPASIGLAQLARLDDHVAAKTAIADRYAHGLGGVPGLRLPTQAPEATSNWWLYTAFVDERAFGMSAEALGRHLDERGIATRRIFTPLYRTAAHAGSERTPMPHAERLGREGLSLPCSVGLRPADQDRVIGEIVRAARPT